MGNKEDVPDTRSGVSPRHKKELNRVICRERKGTQDDRVKSVRLRGHLRNLKEYLVNK